jgi:hypothetical protein
VANGFKASISALAPAWQVGGGWLSEEAGADKRSETAEIVFTRHKLPESQGRMGRTR